MGRGCFVSASHAAIAQAGDDPRQQPITSPRPIQTSSRFRVTSPRSRSHGARTNPATRHDDEQIAAPEPRPVERSLTACVAADRAGQILDRCRARWPTTMVGS